MVISTLRSSPGVCSAVEEKQRDSFPTLLYLSLGVVEDRTCEHVHLGCLDSYVSNAKANTVLKKAIGCGINHGIRQGQCLVDVKTSGGDGWYC